MLILSRLCRFGLALAFALGCRGDDKVEKMLGVNPSSWSRHSCLEWDPEINRMNPSRRCWTKRPTSYFELPPRGEMGVVKISASVWNERTKLRFPNFHLKKLCWQIDAISHYGPTTDVLNYLSVAECTGSVNQLFLFEIGSGKVYLGQNLSSCLNIGPIFSGHHFPKYKSHTTESLMASDAGGRCARLVEEGLPGSHSLVYSELEFSTALGWIEVVLASTAFILTVFLLLRCCGAWFSQFSRSEGFGLKSVFAAVHGWWACKQAESVSVLEEFRKQRLAHIRARLELIAVCSMLLHAAVILTLTVQHRSLLAGDSYEAVQEGWQPLSARVRILEVAINAVQEPSLIAAISIGFIYIVGALFQSKLTDRWISGMNFMHTIFLVLIQIHTSRSPGKLTRIDFVVPFLVMRTLQVLTFEGTLLSIRLQTLVSAMSLVLQTLDDKTINRGPVRSELGVLLMLSTITISQYQNLYQVARSMVEAQTSEAGRNLALGLLGGICDATLELDEEFQITAGLKKFQLLLLRSTGFSTQTKADIFRFMPSEDAIRFREHLKSFERAAMTPQVLHPIYLDLLDASASRVKVKLFCCVWVSVDGLPRYLVGIKESFNHDRFPADPQSSLPEHHPAPGASLVGAAFSDAFLQDKEDSESQSDSSDSSSDAGSDMNPDECKQHSLLLFNGCGRLLEQHAAFKSMYGSGFDHLADFFQTVMDAQKSVRLQEIVNNLCERLGDSGKYTWDFQVTCDHAEDENPEGSLFLLAVKQKKHEKSKTRKSSSRKWQRSSVGPAGSGTPRQHVPEILSLLSGSSSSSNSNSCCSCKDSDRSNSGRASAAHQLSL
eukprot:TRINITY_DN6515_c1_g1_i4.p1 TRINITY_DN6515_c1_g1~~TRINITY_DN6515_c1_g1_i4.p1  ORF type:complete len:832 (-),score=75.10 TRINITY_DN6515_c1_g1_i4:91-2586(-)